MDGHNGPIVSGEISPQGKWIATGSEDGSVFIWDKEVGTKLGMVADHTKIGDHADLGFGIRLPLLGLQIPNRNLTSDERLKIEKMFKSMYDEFLTNKLNNLKRLMEATLTLTQNLNIIYVLRSKGE